MQPVRFLSRLRLSQFRNYPSAALDLDGRPVVLTGPNGSGKTNLLEAISLLSPGRGLRRVPFETLGTQGGDGQWAVAATVESPEGPIDLGTGAALGEGARRVRINGANARAVEDLSAYLRILWLTPAMDGLFTGPPADRRRFLDRLVTALIPHHAAAVADFDKAMRHRNRLLEEDGDPHWLAAIETEMAHSAAAIHFARIDCIGHLLALFAANGAPGDFPRAGLALSPLVEGEGELASSGALEAALAERWRGERGLDRAAGRTTLGPHRAELDVVYAQKGMPAQLGSTGEQKALLIGLVLGHARLVAAMAGIVPFLLLDEIAAHLDPARRGALFGSLAGLGTHVFMTGTDPVLFEALGHEAQHVTVAEGRLRAVS